MIVTTTHIACDYEDCNKQFPPDGGVSGNSNIHELRLSALRYGWQNVTVSGGSQGRREERRVGLGRRTKDRDFCPDHRIR